MSDKAAAVVGPCQVRFPHLETHEVFQGKDTGRFACTFVFDADSDSVKDMKKLIAKANGGNGNDPLSQIDSDSQYDAGMYKIKGKSKYQVKVVDVNGKVVDADAVYGATVQAMLTFAPYTQGKGGVSCYLDAIRVLTPGTGSGGAVDFGPVPAGYEPGSDIDDELPF